MSKEYIDSNNENAQYQDLQHEVAQHPKHDFNGNGNNKAVSKLNIFALILLIAGIALLVIGLKYKPIDGVDTIDLTQNNEEYNGKIIHATADVKGTKLIDPLFNIETEALSLKRKVEIYQWDINENGTLIRTWSDKIIPTPEKSRYENPTEILFSSFEWKKDDIKLGVHDVSGNIKDKIISFEQHNLTRQDYNKLPVNGKKAFKLYNKSLFFGTIPTKPRIGDIRVSYEKAPSGVFSIIAKKEGNKLTDNVNQEITEAIVEKGNLTFENLSGGKEITNVSDSDFSYLTYVGAVLILIAILALIYSLISRRKNHKPEEKISDYDNEEESIAQDDVYFTQADSDDDDFQEYYDEDVEEDNSETIKTAAALGAVVAGAYALSDKDEETEQEEEVQTKNEFEVEQEVSPQSNLEESEIEEIPLQENNIDTDEEISFDEEIEEDDFAIEDDDYEDLDFDLDFGDEGDIELEESENNLDAQELYKKPQASESFAQKEDTELEEDDFENFNFEDESDEGDKEEDLQSEIEEHSKLVKTAATAGAVAAGAYALSDKDEQEKQDEQTEDSFEIEDDDYEDLDFDDDREIKFEESENQLDTQELDKKTQSSEPLAQEEDTELEEDSELEEDDFEDFDFEDEDFEDLNEEIEQSHEEHKKDNSKLVRTAAVAGAVAAGAYALSDKKEEKKQEQIEDDFEDFDFEDDEYIEITEDFDADIEDSNFQQNSNINDKENDIINNDDEIHEDLESEDDKTSDIVSDNEVKESKTRKRQNISNLIKASAALAGAAVGGKLLSSDRAQKAKKKDKLNLLSDDHNTKIDKENYDLIREAGKLDEVTDKDQSYLVHDSKQLEEIKKYIGNDINSEEDEEDDSFDNMVNDLQFEKDSTNEYDKNFSVYQYTYEVRIEEPNIAETFANSTGKNNISKAIDLPPPPINDEEAQYSQDVDNIENASNIENDIEEISFKDYNFDDKDIDLEEDDEK